MTDLSRDIERSNPLKSGLAGGALRIGLWSAFGSNMVAELLSYVGADWILFDMEHAPNDIPGLVSQLQAMNGSRSVPMARPAWNDPVILKQLLDAGVHNFVIPFIQNAEEAKAAVAAVRYPPHGMRGVAAGARGSHFGFEKDYWHEIADRIVVIAQVETREAIGELDSICAVDGIDCAFVGPNDLAASMGHLMNAGCQEVQDLIATVPGICARRGKAAGILAGNTGDVRRYIDMGYRFVGLGSDAGLLKTAALEAVSAARSAGR